MDPTTCSTAGAPSAAPCGWRAGGPEGRVPTGLGRHPSLVAPLRVGLFELLVCSWRALGDLGRFPRFGFPWEGLVHASGRRPVGRVLGEGEGGCLRPAGRTAAPRRGSCSGRRSGRPTGLWGGRDSGSPAGLSGLQGSAALCTGGAPRVPGESLLREDGAAPEAGVAAGRTRAPGPPPPERAGSPWGGADAGVWSHVPACPPAEGPLLPCRGPGRALAVTLAGRGRAAGKGREACAAGRKGDRLRMTWVPAQKTPGHPPKRPELVGGCGAVVGSRADPAESLSSLCDGSEQLGLGVTNTGSPQSPQTDAGKTTCSSVNVAKHVQDSRGETTTLGGKESRKL